MEPASENVGSVAEETIKLARALAGQSFSGHDDTTDDETGHEHPSSCTWCPVCQLINVIRDNPDAVENVTASAAAFAQSVRSFLDAATQHASSKDSGSEER